MALYGRKLFSVLMVSQILMQTAIIECKAGFVSSMLGSAAGTALGKLIKGKGDKDHHHYYQTTIERRETYSNGCFRQIVKQPDTYSPGRIIETDQMVCPPNVQPPISVPGSVPQYQPEVPGVSAAQQIYVISTHTYMSNNGNNLLQQGIVAMAVWALLVYFV